MSSIKLVAVTILIVGLYYIDKWCNKDKTEKFWEKKDESRTRRWSDPKTT